MKKLHPLLYFILGGTFLGLAWLPHLTFLIFIAWVPVFIGAKRVRELSEGGNRPKGFIFYPYLAFLIWNLISTWWVMYASLGGALLAILANALLMSIAFSIYGKLNKSVSEANRIFVFAVVWISFEYFHHQWEGTWPWLTLGNVFAFERNWVQWYEFTGTAGGSLWVILTNIFIYKLIENFQLLNQIQLRKKISILSSVLFFPLLLSYVVYQYRDLNAVKTMDTLIIQPNVDPYNEKFDLEPSIQLNKLKEYTQDKIDSNVQLLLLPETFLTENIWENDLLKSESVKFLQNEFQKKYPKLSILTGANTLYAYSPGEPPSVTARPFDGSFNEYYDYFNSALFLPSKGNLQVYHKSKLVPGVERLPYPAVFKPLEELALNMGGTTGSLGIQQEREVFTMPDATVKLAPVICYESIFGDYVGDYVRRGANIICIITNDGWWDDTPGHKHHLAYGALRAIEFRTSIVRSANTGTSAIIDYRGEIVESRGWWLKDYIRYKAPILNIKTIYAQVGDFISILSCLILILIILLLFYKRIKKT